MYVGLQVALLVKNSACQRRGIQEAVDPCVKDPLEEWPGKLHSRILAWNYFYYLCHAI